MRLGSRSSWSCVIILWSTEGALYVYICVCLYCSTTDVAHWGQFTILSEWSQLTWKYVVVCRVEIRALCYNCLFTMPISQFDRTRIVALIQGGHAQAEVARIVGVTQSAVSKIWKRYDDTNDVVDRRRTDRPKLTTPRQDRYIQTTALRRPTSSARDLPSQCTTMVIQAFAMHPTRASTS